MEPPAANLETPAGIPALPGARRTAPHEAAKSPLGSARVRRRLSVEEVAARTGLDVEAVKALEEGRIYRFPSVHEALAAVLVYAGALDISEREARRLAGLPVGPERRSLRRWLPIAAFAVALASLAWFVTVPETMRPRETASPEPAAPKLPPPWEIRVDVFNGTDVANAATLMANEIGGPLAYRLGAVESADRVDYLQTRVYYPPGSSEIAARLARALGIQMTGLPSGDDPNRLVVIVGRDRAGGGG